MCRGLSLDRPGEVRRRLWNLGRLVLSGKVGGFQYSSAFLEPLWQRHRARLRGHDVINCYQVYPDSVLGDAAIAKWFYIDATMTQVFDDQYSAKLPPAIKAKAIAREAKGYAVARGIVCHSHWAARSVCEDYGIDPAKVHVVVPGANLPVAKTREFLAREAAAAPHESGPLRLAFVGRYWDRKGLDRLLAAIRIAQARGGTFALRVIGCEREGLPADLQDVPGVEWCGSIEKRAEAERFLETVHWAEMGCLLSRHEFGGMVQREFAALGLVALGPDVCGAPDHAGPGALLVGPEETPEAIAAHLLEMAKRGEAYHRLRAAAYARREEALWSSAMARVAAIVEAG